MKKILISLILILTLLGGVAVSCRIFLIRKDKQVISPVSNSDVRLVIDAGHGGEDGGAVSLSGAKESLINLAIAYRLDQIMGFYGVPTVMLRTADISLHDNTADTLREKKTSDLHNRADTTNSFSCATLISIHQNSFPNPKYSGAHVFYAPTKGSQAFAEMTQETLRISLNPQNQRTAAQIPSSVYLMNNIKCPAILVECGFLSNREEDQLLQTPEYQLMLATAISGAYFQYQEITKDDA